MNTLLKRTRDVLLSQPTSTRKLQLRFKLICLYSYIYIIYVERVYMYKVMFIIYIIIHNIYIIFHVMCHTYSFKQLLLYILTPWKVYFKHYRTIKSSKVTHYIKSQRFSWTFKSYHPLNSLLVGPFSSSQNPSHENRCPKPLNIVNC